jgi:hypothetical protein
MVCGVIRCVSEWVCIWCVWQALGSRAGAMCKTQHKTHLALPLKHMILPQAPSPLHHSPLPSSPPLPPPPTRMSVNLTHLHIVDRGGAGQRGHGVAV